MTTPNPQNHRPHFQASNPGQPTPATTTKQRLRRLKPKRFLTNTTSPWPTSKLMTAPTRRAPESRSRTTTPKGAA